MSDKSQVIDKDFGDEWTGQDWIEWAYKLGLRLDRWIPWAGIDNRKRIEQAIMEYVILKSKPAKVEEKEEVIKNE